MRDAQERKKFLINIAIIGLSVLIFSIWVLNLKNIWINTKSLSTDNGKFYRLQENLDETVKSIEEKLDSAKREQREKNRIKNDVFLKELLQQTEKYSSSTASTTIVEEKKGSSTEVVATSSLILPKATDSCPEYINCMPTFDNTSGMRNCHISAGCEGKTKILY